MKKIALLLGAVAAAPLCAENYEATGFHGGIEGGYASGASHYKYKTNSKTDKYDFSSEGGSAGVFLGYTQDLGNKFFLTAQINGGFSNLKGQMNHVDGGDSVQISSKLKHKYGLALYAGYDFSGVLVSLKVGGSSGKWEAKRSNPAKGSGKLSKDLLAFDVGVGVDFPINKELSIGGEFTHSRYKKGDFDYKNDAGQKLGSSSIQPVTNVFSVRLKYTPGWNI